MPPAQLCRLSSVRLAGPPMLRMVRAPVEGSMHRLDGRLRVRYRLRNPGDSIWQETSFARFIVSDANDSFAEESPFAW